MAIVRVDAATGAIVGRTARFVIAPQAIWRELIRVKALSPVEVMVLHGLSTFIQFRTNALAQHGAPMTIADMARALDMDAGNMRRYVGALVRKNALGKWQSGPQTEYVVNPALYRVGTPDPAIVLLFDQRREKYRRDGRLPLTIHGRATTLVP